MAVNWFQKFKSIGFVVDDQLEKNIVHNENIRMYTCTLSATCTYV
jgi:hypothetical protein